MATLQGTNPAPSTCNVNKHNTWSSHPNLQAVCNDEEAETNSEEEEYSDDEGGFLEDDSTEFEPGQGVEDMLKLLEEGGAMPDIEGLMEAEDPHV